MTTMPASQPTATGMGTAVPTTSNFRYADRFIGPSQDLIFGVSLNNNPSISDPWNTAPAWMQYVPPGSPGAYSFVDANAPYPGTASDGGVAGLTAYMLWNKSIYGEVGFYRTADNLLSFMTAGTPDEEKTHLQGSNNPYWRLAYTHEWGPSNIMVGTSGMVAHVFDGSTKPSDHNAYQRIETIGLDTQYQYLLDPHTVTAQLAYMKMTVDDSVNGEGGTGIDKPVVLRGKVVLRVPGEIRRGPVVFRPDRRQGLHAGDARSHL